jgi:hypothetical protein
MSILILAGGGGDASFLYAPVHSTGLQGGDACILTGDTVQAVRIRGLVVQLRLPIVSDLRRPRRLWFALWRVAVPEGVGAQFYRRVPLTAAVDGLRARGDRIDRWRGTWRELDLGGRSS